jgi:pseudouridine-5'-phosphate glycosidase
MAVNVMASPDFVVPTPEIFRALKSKAPIVALESTVITHGLPYPQNLQLARGMEAEVRRAGATPATIALLDGKVRIGLMDDELARLAESKSNLKVSPRDITTAIVKKASGGTTVAATMFAASKMGIRVFATGGIGGVHRGNIFDISSDLKALAETYMVVVCSGAKAILDLPATLEYLETMGVPVIGYKTEEFPAFYSRESGLKVNLQLDSPQAIANYCMTHRSLHMMNAVLVTNPVPEADSIPRSEIEPVIKKASREAMDKKIQGQQLTPFLLQRISELTYKKSLRANLALLLNNARLAAQIASALATYENRREI